MAAGADRMRTIMTVLAADAATALTWDMLSLVRPEVLGELVGRYGIDAVATELERRAELLREMGRRLKA